MKKLSLALFSLALALGGPFAAAQDCVKERLTCSAGGTTYSNTMNMFGYMPNVAFRSAYSSFAATDGPNYDIYTVPAGKRAMIFNYNFNAMGVNGPTTAGTITITPQVKISGTYYPTGLTSQTIAGGTGQQNTIAGSFSGQQIGPYIAEAGEILSFKTTALTLTSVANHTNTALTLSAAAAVSSGVTVYTGTITGGGTSAFAGYTFTVAGFTNSANNGTFLCVGSSTTTLALVNLNGATESHAGTATTPEITVYTGTSIPTTLGGTSVVIAGFVTSANNGTFQVLASTSTTITTSNTSGASESAAATATPAPSFSVQATILEYDNTSALKSVKITSPAQGANALYTPSGSKTGLVIGSTFGSMFSSNSGSANAGAALFYSNPSATASVGYVHYLQGSTITSTLTAAGTAVGGNTLYTGTISRGAGSVVYALTASANASGGNTVYTGTLANCTANQFAGYVFVVTGFANAVNNGIFTATACSSTTLTLNNASGVSSTVQVATAQLSPFSNSSVTVTGFANSANNGTFTCVWSTSTQMLLANASGTAETHAGSASLPVIPLASNRILTSASINASGAGAINPTIPLIFTVANGDTLSVFLTIGPLTGGLLWTNVIEF